MASINIALVSDGYNVARVLKNHVERPFGIKERAAEVVGNVAE
jgi:hypothetical protein